jgi:type II secretory pathway component PulF
MENQRFDLMTGKMKPASGKIRGKAALGSRKTRISHKVCAILFRQISISLHSGLSLISAIDLSLKQQKHSGTRRLLQDMLAEISSGGFVSDSLESWSGAISPVVPKLIRVGEETGNLDSAFGSSATMCEFLYTLNQRIISSLTYPVFLLVFSFLILPLPHLFASGLSAYLQMLQFPFLCLLSIALLWVIMRYVLTQSPRAGRILKQGLLALPVIGSAQRKITTARFARVLSAGISAALDIGDAVKLSADASGNPFIQKKMYAIVPSLICGETSLTAALSGSGEFSSVFCNLLAVGEKTGNLEEMLLKAAEIHQEEALTAIDRTTKLLGPVVLIIIAVYLGYQIVSFWTSYFSDFRFLVQLF